MSCLSTTPGEHYQAPRSWAEQDHHNLIYYNRADQGGHYAPGNSRKSFHRRFARASDHCANKGRSGRDSLAREFSGMQFDKVVHAERLLARELKQILGHTVVAVLLGQLRHHAEVLDRMRRHARF